MYAHVNIKVLTFLSIEYTMEDTLYNVRVISVQFNVVMVI